MNGYHPAFFIIWNTAIFAVMRGAYPSRLAQRLNGSITCTMLSFRTSLNEAEYRMPRKKKEPKPCRHCGKPARRPRQLCWHCYYTPTIAQHYPPLPNKFNQRGRGNHTGRSKLPALPCPYLPGSPEKIIIMSRRAARGESLFHPEDGPY